MKNCYILLVSKSYRHRGKNGKNDAAAKSLSLMCENQILTVKYIFLHCFEFYDIRNGLFNVWTLEQRLRDINKKSNTFVFLWEAGLYNLFNVECSHV